MPKIKIKKRVFGIFTLFAILLCCLSLRTAFLQLVQGEQLQRDAIEQQTRDRIITSKRGSILDRNGKALAVSASVESVSATPSEIQDIVKKSKDQSLTVESIAQGLSDILQIKYEDVLKKLTNKSSYEIIKRKIEKEEADKVRAFIEEKKISGINLDEDSKRYYPFANFASQLIGATGVDNQGLDGVEAICDSVLKGVPGRVIAAKSAQGIEMPFKYEKYIDPQDGVNVMLTIDESIQHFAEKHLETAVIENKVAKGGVAMVMDVKTGELLAMATNPDYDLNQPFTINNQQLTDEIAKLSGDEKTKKYNDELLKMWRNKAVSDTYEPGSTFKIFTTSMALETNVIGPNDTFTCTGSRTVANRVIHCWKAGGHGTQTFEQALQNSCNPAFMEIGARIGNQNFMDFFNGFGFMDKTGIELNGEATGIFHIAKNFNEVELATSSFGQSFQVTPLQMITAASAVANNGMLMWPHVIKAYTDKDGNVVQTFSPKMIRQVVSKETSAEVRMLLEKVVSVGSAKNAYVAGYRIAGKTGTSEKLPRNNGKYVSSFIGFAPADNPQIACIVLLDEPMGDQYYGGIIAAPVVGKIMEDVLRYLNIEPQYTQAELDTLETPVPDVKDIGVGEAQKVITSKKLKYRVEGGGKTVISQMPKAGARVNANSTITLYTSQGQGTNMVKVPDVLKCTVAEAVQRLTNANLNIKIVGAAASGSSGVYSAFNQDPPAQSDVEQGAVVKVEFRTLEVGGE